MQKQNAELIQLLQLKSPDSFSDFVVDFIRKFDLNFDVLMDATRKKLILAEYENSGSISTTILRTGIKRHHIRKTLSDIDDEVRITKSQFLHYVRQEIRIFCNGHKRVYITRFEFNEIVDRISLGEVTQKTCLSELASQNFIRISDEKLFLLPFDPEKFAKHSNYINLIVDCLSKVIETAYYNRPDNNAMKKLFQRIYRSSQISPDDAIVLEYETKKLNKKYWNDLINLINSLESDVPAGTYEDVGTLLMQFNLNKTTEK